MNRFALILPLLMLTAPAMAADQPQPQQQDELANTMNAALQRSSEAVGNLGNAARVAMQQRAQLQALLIRAVELCGDRCTELTAPKAAEPAAPAPVEAKPEVAAPSK